MGGDGEREWGTGMGIGIVLGSEESDQRYSGKPDGFAGTPKENKKKAPKLYNSGVLILSDFQSFRFSDFENHFPSLNFL